MEVVVRQTALSPHRFVLQDDFSVQDIQVGAASVSMCFSPVFDDSIYTAQTSTCHRLWSSGISCSFGITVLYSSYAKPDIQHTHCARLDQWLFPY